jgi:hypothetical protein
MKGFIMIKRGDTVRRKDGTQVSFCLPGDGMTAKVVVGQGETLGEFAWHYNDYKPIPMDKIGIHIGLFPTFVNVDEFEVVDC